MLSFNVYPDAAAWFTKFAVTSEQYAMEEFCQRLRGQFHPILLFCFLYRLSYKSKVNASQGVVMGFIGSKEPS